MIRSTISLFLILIFLFFPLKLFAIDLQNFKKNLEKVNSLDGILKNTPEAIFLDTLNSIYKEIDRNTLSNSELENAITLLESLDLLEENFPRNVIIKFEEDFLSTANLTKDDLNNASFFLNSLNAKKIKKIRDINSLLKKKDSKFSKIQYEVISSTKLDIKKTIKELQTSSKIDLNQISLTMSKLENKIITGAQEANKEISRSLNVSSNQINNVISDLEKITKDLSFAGGAAMAAAAYSLDAAATVISNSISAGITVDLEAVSQGMGYNSFADAVSAYNEQYGTNYTVDTAKEALGQ